MGILIYFLIFFQKIIENALSSFRLIVYTAGHKHIGALLIAINSLLWVIVISIILHDITSDPKKIIIYAIGQIFGTYIGIVIEEKMAIGKYLLYVVIKKENEQTINNKLREKGLGVTSVDAKGYFKDEKALLMIFCKRRNKKEVEKIIKVYEEDVVIMAKKPMNVSGGYVVV